MELKLEYGLVHHNLEKRKQESKRRKRGTIPQRYSGKSVAFDDNFRETRAGKRVAQCLKERDRDNTVSEIKFEHELNRIFLSAS